MISQELGMDMPLLMYLIKQYDDLTGSAPAAVIIDLLSQSLQKEMLTLILLITTDINI